MERIAVVGAGSWGTTVAHLGGQRVETVLWARRPELAARINETRRNDDYLPELQLSERLRATADI